MAKRKPTLTLIDMEEEIGYKVAPTDPNENTNRFYSDLRPVPVGIYERTKKEYEAFVKRRNRKDRIRVPPRFLPRLNESERVDCDEDTVILAHNSNVGLYRFFVDICYGFGLNLSLLFSEDEAARFMSVVKLQARTIQTTQPSTFFSLPSEIRQKIYFFTLPRGKWSIKDIETFEQDNVARGIGDPSGFYYPLSKGMSVLRVNRQMRQEALPVAYCRTNFHLDDIDDVIKLLVAIGQIGRDNLESLRFSWQSRTDAERKWDNAPDYEDHHLTLPVLHVSDCVQLLKQCRKLKHLRLYFESELIMNMRPDTFMADPGIEGLCSIRGMTTVEIWDLGDVNLEQCYLAKSIKEKMESPKEKA